MLGDLNLRRWVLSTQLFGRWTLAGDIFRTRQPPLSYSLPEATAVRFLSPRHYDGLELDAET